MEYAIRQDPLVFLQKVFQRTRTSGHGVPALAYLPFTMTEDMKQQNQSRLPQRITAKEGCIVKDNWIP